MIDKKKVVLLGVTLVVVIGCNALAKSKANFSSIERGGRENTLKPKYSNSQVAELQDASGDSIKEKKQGKNKSKKCTDNLSEEEKEALKEKFDNLSEEEKEALKEKRTSLKKSKRENFENLSEEEKATLKEKRTTRRTRNSEKNETTKTKEV